MTTLSPTFAQRRRRRTQRIDRAFRLFCAACTLVGILALAALIGKILYEGLPKLTWSFLTSFPSRKPEEAGLKAALFGSVWLMGIVAAVAVPIGVSAAIYLEEYGRKGRLSNLLETNISNLAGVPSIVYGILGLAIFVRAFQLGVSVLAGGLTLALLVLPVIIVSAREAIRAVPPGYRNASYALGATKWQTTYKVVLPSAIPGIMTGVILSLSRAIGETAPLILVGAAAYLAFVPQGLLDQYTALPMQIYDWASRPQKSFQDLAAAGIIVLLAVLFAMNGVAIYLRHRFIGKHKG